MFTLIGVIYEDSLNQDAMVGTYVSHYYNGYNQYKNTIN